jgi:hypothetical protein
MCWNLTPYKWRMCFLKSVTYYHNLWGTVGIATGYFLDSPGSIPEGENFFCSPQRPDLLWGPPLLLSNTYWGTFPWSWIGWALRPRSRKVDLYLETPTRLHGIMLSKSITGTTLFLSKKETYSVARVRERTVPTERPPLVIEVSANFCG